MPRASAWTPKGQAAAQTLEALGARLRQVRKHAKMDSKSVAAAAGLPASTVSKIENGKQNPTLLTLARIAQALGCTLIDIMPDAPRPRQEPMIIPELPPSRE